MNSTMIQWADYYADLPTPTSAYADTCIAIPSVGFIYQCQYAASVYTWVPIAIIPPLSPSNGDILEFNGNKWVNAAGFNLFATQTNVTASRALSTGSNNVYHNTSTKPMMVTVSLNFSSSASVRAKTDTNTLPTTIVTDMNLSSGNTSCSFIVLPGNYYIVWYSGANASITYWIEWV
jgi:hypothetical protein